MLILLSLCGILSVTTFRNLSNHTVLPIQVWSAKAIYYYKPHPSGSPSSTSNGDDQCVVELDISFLVLFVCLNTRRGQC